MAQQNPPTSNPRIAQVAQGLQELDKIWKTRFQKAGLPREPWRLTVDDVWKRFPYLYSNRGMPFEPEESYLQYQSFWDRDFCMDDTALRLQVIGHRPNGQLNPSTKRKASQSESDADKLQVPVPPKKRITLAEYKTRSLANSAASTPRPAIASAVEHPVPSDLRKEAAKNACSGKSQGIEQSLVASVPLDGAKSLPPSPPEIKIHKPDSVPISTVAVECPPTMAKSHEPDVLPTSTTPMEAPPTKAVTHEPDVSATSKTPAGPLATAKSQQVDFPNSRKRAHGDSAVDSGHDPEPLSKRTKTSDVSTSKKPMPAATVSVSPKVINAGSFQKQKTEVEMKRTVAEESSPKNMITNHAGSTRKIAIPSSRKTYEPMLLGPKPACELKVDLPWLTPDRGSTTPPSPDTIGARHLSSTATSESSVLSETFDVWNPHHETVFKPKAKPAAVSKESGGIYPTARKASSNATSSVTKAAPSSVGKKAEAVPAAAKARPSAASGPPQTIRPGMEGKMDGARKPAILGTTAPPIIKKEKKLANDVSAAFFKQFTPTPTQRPHARPATPSLTRPTTASSDSGAGSATTALKPPKLVVKLRYADRHAAQIMKIMGASYRKKKPAVVSNESLSPTKPPEPKQSLPNVEATASTATSSEQKQLTDTSKTKTASEPTTGFTMSKIMTTISRRPYE